MYILIYFKIDYNTFQEERQLLIKHLTKKEGGGLL